MSLPVGKGLIQIPDGSLEYELLRPARTVHADTTIVMLHEGLGSVAMWKAFPADVAEATGCWVLAYSRLGYGGSTPCPLPRPLSYMHDEAEILDYVVNRIGHQKIVLLGHSDGASISAIYAGSRANTRLRGIILMAPHFFTERMALTAIERAGIAYERGDLRDRLVRYHGANVDVAFRGWIDAWLNPAFHQWDIRELIPHIKVPSLLIQGTDDEYGSHAQLDTMEALCPAPVTVQLLEKCRHSPHRDRLADTLAAITGFVSDLLTTR